MVQTVQLFHSVTYSYRSPNFQARVLPGSMNRLSAVSCHPLSVVRLSLRMEDVTTTLFSSIQSCYLNAFVMLVNG